MTGYSIEDLTIKKGNENPSENMEKNQSVIEGDVISKLPLYIGHKNSINSKNEVLHYEKFLNPGYFWTSVSGNFIDTYIKPIPNLNKEFEQSKINDRPSSNERLANIAKLRISIIGNLISGDLILDFYISLKNKYIASFANKFFDVRTKILNGKLEIK